jgi:anti-anti-sigma factor
MGEALLTAFELGAANPLLINASATHYMSSTAFAVLMKFGRDVRASGGRVAICAMDPSVRLGANILQLGQVVPIFDDEPTAIAALIV